MSKLRIVPSQKFNRDVKLAIKRGYNIQLLDAVVEMIAEQQLLPPKYKDHKLIGNYSGCRECYITPDRLLIYEISNEELILYLTKNRNTQRFILGFLRQGKKLPCLFYYPTILRLYM